MHEKIAALAAVIARPTAEETPLLEALCTAAEAEAVGRLREGIAAEDCGEALPCAGALLAAAGLLPARSGTGVEQFTAGEVSIRTGGGGELCQLAAAFRRQAAELMAPFWRDDGFAFLGVRG